MRKILGTVAALAVLAVAGCSSNSTATQSSATNAAGSGATSGGATGQTDLKVARPQVPQGPSLDPMLTTYNDPEMTNIFEAMTVVDTKGKLQPQLAVSWKNTSPTTWEFKLRSGVKFSNGDPMTATDVKYSFDRVMDPANKSPNTHFNGVISSAKVVDDLTIEFVTAAPTATLPNTLAMLQVVPAKLVSQQGNAAFAKNPVGTGPYKFVSWEVGSNIVEESNPSYWGGAPAITKITYLAVPSPSTRKAMLLDGSADLASGILYTDEPVITADANLKILKSQTDNTDFVSINTLKPPFDNVKVRQALSYAVDVDSIISKVIGGSGARVAMQNSLLDSGADKDLKPYPYDPDKAKQLLADAGYGPDNPFPAQSMDVGTDRQPYNTDIAQAIAGYLSAVGIPTKVNVMESTALFDKYLSGDAGLLYSNSRSASGESIDRFQGFYSSTGRALYWHTPEMDAMIVKARAEFDPAKRQVLYNEIQQTIYDQATTIAMFDEVQTYGMKKSLDWIGATPNGTLSFGAAKFTS